MSSLVREEAVARAAGVGAVPVLVVWWERRWRTGEPTHSFTSSPKSSARARPNREEAGRVTAVKFTVRPENTELGSTQLIIHLFETIC